MLRFFAFVLAFVVSPAFAVSVVADLPDQTTTHCVLELDTVWGPETVVGTVSDAIVRVRCDQRRIGRTP